MTIESLLFQVDAAVAAQTAKENTAHIGKVASQFFDQLIRFYEPLVAAGQQAQTTQ